MSTLVDVLQELPETEQRPEVIQAGCCAYGSLGTCGVCTFTCNASFF